MFLQQAAARPASFLAPTDGCIPSWNRRSAIRAAVLVWRRPQTLRPARAVATNANGSAPALVPGSMPDLPALQSFIAGCPRCKLAGSRTNIVNGLTWGDTSAGELEFKFPKKFLDTYFDVVYSTGTTEVFH